MFITTVCLSWNLKYNFDVCIASCNYHPYTNLSERINDACGSNTFKLRYISCVEIVRVHYVRTNIDRSLISAKASLVMILPESNMCTSDNINEVMTRVKRDYKIRKENNRFDHFPDNLIHFNDWNYSNYSDIGN